MYHSYHHHLLISNPLSLTHHHYPSLSHFLHKPITIHTVSAIPPIASSSTWLTQLASVTEELELGSIELPFSTSTFGATDDPSTVQVASAVILTGAITFFLFRSIQRRAKRAKALKFRSSGVKRSLGELKAMGSSSIKAKKSPPSPDQALLGAIIAGVIAVILYRFTTTIEATLGRQTISDNFSVRQITITIRTIINGLCYLATFVYGINSVGLLLYSGQLALNTFVGEPTSGRKEAESSKIIANSPVENLTNSNKLNSTKEDQSSSNSQ